MSGSAAVSAATCQSSPPAAVLKPVTVSGRIEDGADSRQFRSRALSTAQRTTSCPPGKVHSATAGPWSLEWAHRHKEAEVRAFSKKDSGVGNSTSSVIGGKRKKESGRLRHCAKNLKRIARLSEEDRMQVLRDLRKTRRRRKKVLGTSNVQVISNDTSSVDVSQTSVSNDWKNWLAMHGSGEVLSADVRELGKVVGLKFQGDKNNSFDVLSGAGRKNKEGVGKE